MERKSRQVRQRIVEAADDLFRANGFDGVSVTDIAARADVGRTTFFRYFGDKAEVVFAKEQAILDAIAAHAEGGPAEIAQTPRQAIEQLRPIVLKICEQASSDADGYALHARLLDQHVELRARDALKTQLAADRLAEVLVARGTQEAVAVLAANVALACYQTARRRADGPRTLTAETSAAFDSVVSLSA